MTPSLSPHPRRRRPLRAAALLLVLVALAAGVALAVQPSTPRVPLEPGIPNEQALIDAGLAAVPGPGQPTRPVAVDRVLVDGAATYVQYHTAASPSPSSDPSPTLSDDQGAPVAGDIYSGVSSVSDWTFPVPLPAWLPWHLPTVRRGYIILAPLPPTARAAVLHFGAPGGPPGPGAGETVRVPLGPRTRLLSRVAYPGTTAHAAGLTLTLRTLGPAHLTYADAPPGGARSPASLSSSFSSFSGTTPGGAAPNPAGQLTVRAGHPLPTVTLSTTCAADAHGLRCATTLAFPPQPPGARLTLTVRTLPGGTPFPPATPRPRHGLWRLSLTIP